ncbi:MAG: V-type ATPase 116kDa subunit family protein [Ruminococcus sp.]|nr:V-type ATPase 116kDa subunit family protein [Ruminococcus sp.]
MAVSSMHAVNIVGFIEDIDEVITTLGESGVFHPDDVSVFYNDTKGFTHLQTKNIYSEHLTNLKAALSPTKRQYKYVDVSNFRPTYDEIIKFTEEISSVIDDLTDDRDFADDQLQEAKQNLADTKHFLGLDIEIEKLLSLKYLKATFGRLPKESYEKLQSHKGNDSSLAFFICTEDKNCYWGVYLSPTEKSEETDKFFSRLFFEKCDIIGVNSTPVRHIEKLTALIPMLEEKKAEAEKKLNDFLDENSEKISKYLSKLEELSLYSTIRARALQYNNSFIIVGWVPTENVKEIESKLSELKSVSVELSDAKNEIRKSPPVKLKNCFLARPFEYYTSMYGMAKYNEIDPSLFVAITYIIIFGIMFGDVGQGICLTIVGALMWKLKKMPIGKILAPCGVSSTFFGFVFGSVFGFEHLLDPMYEALFGLEEKPIEVMSPEMATNIILVAIGIGVFLLILAMCLNVYTSIRQKNYGKALFSTSGVAGIIFYSSLVFGLVGQLFLGMNILTLPYILGLVVLPFIFIFFAEPLTGLVNKEEDWKPESWGGYIVENIFESIEVLLSYVTNTMSFLRVGAFVLVHAGMMMVVFVLAETAGGFFYWPIIVIGNGIVMALEALLVAIQVLRLEYYELFSRFFTGEGRAYEPVKLKTE